MFVANLIVVLWKKSNLLKIVSVFLVIFLTLSGLIDLMPIKNDYKISLKDYPQDQRVAFFRKIDPKSITLNSTSLYHPASLAGRYIFYGYSYFAWSYGYDTQKRESIYLKIYRSNTQKDACQLLKQNNISYVELSKNADDFIKPNKEVWSKFKKIFESKSDNFVVYDVSKSCLFE